MAVGVVTDRGCLRGCAVPGEHYASCPSFGPNGDGSCSGCVLVPARDGVLVCEGCWKRARWLLSNVGDMWGRVRSLADPLKAVVAEPVRSGRVLVEAPAPVGADLLDAVVVLRLASGVWAGWGEDVDAMLNDREMVGWVSAVVMDRHPVVDGVRSGWSVQDAVDQWGVERRDPSRFRFPVEDEVLSVQPVTEWYDRLLAARDAAKRAGVSERALRRWVEREVLVPAARSRDARGVVTKWFRASEVDAAAAVVRERAEASRFGGGVDE